MNDTHPQIVFERYVSDGPGYSGRVGFALSGASICQARIHAGQQVTEEVALGVTLPEVEAVFDVSGDGSAACEAVFEAVRQSDGWLAYLESPGGVDADRLKLLHFKDGSRGAIMLGGEPCFFVLIAGDRVVDVADGQVCASWRLERPFSPSKDVTPDRERPSA